MHINFTDNNSARVKKTFSEITRRLPNSAVIAPQSRLIWNQHPVESQLSERQVKVLHSQHVKCCKFLLYQRN